MWHLGYSAYAIVLWVSLGDSTSNINGNSYTDCEDFFINFSSDYEQFLMLWKITASVYFMNTFILVAMIMCYCDLARSEKKPEQVNVRYEALEQDI